MRSSPGTAQSGHRARSRAAGSSTRRRRDPPEATRARARRAMRRRLRHRRRSSPLRDRSRRRTRGADQSRGSVTHERDPVLLAHKDQTVEHESGELVEVANCLRPGDRRRLSTTWRSRGISPLSWDLRLGRTRGIKCRSGNFSHDGASAIRPYWNPQDRYDVATALSGRPRAGLGAVWTWHCARSAEPGHSLGELRTICRRRTPSRPSHRGPFARPFPCGPLRPKARFGDLLHTCRSA